MNAEQWNARHPVGTLVFAYPGVRPEGGAGTRLVTRTRTEAQLSASGDPVVWVEGEGSYICLTHVDPVAEDVWEAARKAEEQAEPEAKPVSPARLSQSYETSLRSVAAATTNDPVTQVHRDQLTALLAELDAVRAERDQARSAAFAEAAALFDRLADDEPDQHGYRARVMRGAANDVRGLNNQEGA